MTATLTTFPEVLYLLDPDWCECTYRWMTAEGAAEAVDDLRDDFGWDISFEQCRRFERVGSSNGDACVYREAYSGDDVVLTQAKGDQWREVNG